MLNPRVQIPRKLKPRAARRAKPLAPRKPKPAPRAPTLFILAERQRLGETAHRLARAKRAVSDSRWRTIVLAQQRGKDATAPLARALRGKAPLALIGLGEDVKRAHVAQAFRALRSRRYAVGPTKQGGVWIVAARTGRDAAAPLRAMRWGAPLDDILGRLPDLPAELATI